VIRRATPADQAALEVLVREFNAIDNHPHDDDRVASALRPLLEDDAFGLVYVWGDPVEGYCIVTWSYSLESGGRDALIDEYFTQNRGQGIGGMALSEVLDHLKEFGIPRIFLETETANEAVRRFYSRHGFVEEASIWMSRDL
jgi:RimJ/RimL family protein N-acetyltransferase